MIGSQVLSDKKKTHVINGKDKLSTITDGGFKDRSISVIIWTNYVRSKNSSHPEYDCWVADPKIFQYQNFLTLIYTLKFRISPSSLT